MAKTVAKTKDNAMVPVYGSLIIKGQKTLSDVPEIIREDVGQWLIENGHPELADEDL